MSNYSSFSLGSLSYIFIKNFFAISKDTAKGISISIKSPELGQTVSKIIKVMIKGITKVITIVRIICQNLNNSWIRNTPAINKKAPAANSKPALNIINQNTYKTLV